MNEREHWSAALGCTAGMLLMALVGVIAEFASWL